MNNSDYLTETEKFLLGYIEHIPSEYPPYEDEWSEDEITEIETLNEIFNLQEGEIMKKQAAWIQEKTKEEVEVLRDKLLKSGRIKSAGEIEKYIYCRNRKTGEPIYHYQCECEEAQEVVK